MDAVDAADASAATRPIWGILGAMKAIVANAESERAEKWDMSAEGWWLLAGTFSTFLACELGHSPSISPELTGLLLPLVPSRHPPVAQPTLLKPCHRLPLRIRCCLCCTSMRPCSRSISSSSHRRSCSPGPRTGSSTASSRTLSSSAIRPTRDTGKNSSRSSSHASSKGAQRQQRRRSS